MDRTDLADPSRGNVAELRAELGRPGPEPIGLVCKNHRMDGIRRLLLRKMGLQAEEGAAVFDFPAVRNQGENVHCMGSQRVHCKQSLYVI